MDTTDNVASTEQPVSRQRFRRQKLTDEDRAKLMREGRCFRCRTPFKGLPSKQFGLPKGRWPIIRRVQSLARHHSPGLQLQHRFDALEDESNTFSPAELSSERGEKEVLADSNQPTAHPSTKSHATFCVERKWRPEVHQARRDDRFSSRFLSLLLTAAIVPTSPTPQLLCSPLPLSLSDQV